MNGTYSDTFSLSNNNKRLDLNKDIENIDYDDLYKRLMGLVKI